MTRTSRLITPAKALLVSMLVGTFAVVLMDGRTGFPAASASVTQNANKSGGTGNKKGTVKPKPSCSKADDKALADEIQARLSKHASLKDENEIKVDVNARVATLTGTVKVKSHKLIAAAEARKVKCIKKVINWVCTTRCSDPDIYCCHGVCQSTPCPEKDKAKKTK